MKTICEDQMPIRYRYHQSFLSEVLQAGLSSLEIGIDIGVRDAIKEKLPVSRLWGDNELFNVAQSISREADIRLTK